MQFVRRSSLHLTVDLQLLLTLETWVPLTLHLHLGNLPLWWACPHHVALSPICLCSACDVLQGALCGSVVTGVQTEAGAAQGQAT